MARKSDNGFYSDDVNALAQAENDNDADSLVENNEPEVTSGNLTLGDMNNDIKEDPSASEDEEAIAAYDEEDSE